MPPVRNERAKGDSEKLPSGNNSTIAKRAVTLHPVDVSVSTGSDEIQITAIKHFPLNEINTITKARKILSRHFSHELTLAGIGPAYLLYVRLHTINYDPTSTEEPFRNVVTQGLYKQWIDEIEAAPVGSSSAKLEFHVTSTNILSSSRVEVDIPEPIEVNGLTPANHVVVPKGEWQEKVSSLRKLSKQVNITTSHVKKLQKQLKEAESRAEQAEKDLKENERIWDKVFEEGQAKWVGQKDEDDDVSVEDEPIEDEDDEWDDDGWRHYGQPEEGYY